ncbi:DUF6160 family protein [Acinetobacter indicus]|uniref:DUF6160 family protein n=1 Tax=Acinetobacter indicus TaxID=756892 RepID=UPI00398950EB
MKKIMQLNLLTLSVLCAQQVYALELIADQHLANVSGQDGMVITHEMSKATIQQANWYDPDLVDGAQLGLGLHNVEINGQNNQPIISKLALDVGKTDVGAGVRIDASIDAFQSTADLNLVKRSCVANSCTKETQSLGRLGLEIKSPLKVLLETKAGLFNKNETAHLNFQLKNAKISHGLGNHQLSMHDFNFNFATNGYMYIDADEGLVFTTKNGSTDHFVNLGRVADLTDVANSRQNATNPGVNIDLRYNDKNLIRFGASGAVTNAKLFFNGQQSGAANFNVSNKNNGIVETQNVHVTGYEDVLGQGGLHLGLSADFTNQNTVGLQAGQLPTTLEIGHTGNGSYAVEFSNLRPLTTRNAQGELHHQNAYIDFGDLYINTVQAKNLNFLVNENIKNTLGVASPILNQVLSSQLEGEQFALIAVRGMDFQSIAAKARFISDNSIDELTGDGGSWGIGIPIYNLNANVALSGKTYQSPYDGATKTGIGYNALVSTEGYGIDSKTGLPSTTSIILIDGQDSLHAGESVNYYAGLRNIDALIQSEGVIGYEDEGIYIRADHLLLAAKAELAIGQLPGSKYNCVTGSTKCGSFVPHDNFAKKDDVLTTIALKLDGNGELLVIPGINPTANDPHSNFLSFDANFQFKSLTDAEKADPNNLGSYLSLINEDQVNNETIQTSSINLNRMEGHIGLKGKVLVSADTVTLDNQVKFNYKNDIAQPFKTDFAMSTNGNMQKIASVAFTGGSMRSTLGITPR